MAKTIKIGVLIFPDVQPMDVIGPWEVFAMWKNILSVPVELYLIAEELGKVDCDNDINLIPHKDFNSCPELDYLIIPGGRGRLQQVANKKLLGFIQQQAKHCQKILSVCTGFFILYHAGLLTGKKVTTYWRALPELHTFNDVEIVEQRIVKNDDIWLAGGVTSGIDLALELINDIAGQDAAGKVQLLLEYFPNHHIYSTSENTQTLPDFNQRKTDTVAEYMQRYLKKL